jgi:hypothetical protein
MNDADCNGKRMVLFCDEVVQGILHFLLVLTRVSHLSKNLDSLVIEIFWLCCMMQLLIFLASWISIALGVPVDTLLDFDVNDLNLIDDASQADLNVFTDNNHDEYDSSLESGTTLSFADGMDWDSESYDNDWDSNVPLSTTDDMDLWGSDSSLVENTYAGSDITFSTADDMDWWSTHSSLVDDINAGSDLSFASSIDEGLFASLFIFELALSVP